MDIKDAAAQGLFCRALDTAGFETTRIDDIFTAALDSLTDESSVLHENMTFTSAYGDFTGDHATGKGILLRSARQFISGPTACSRR